MVARSPPGVVLALGSARSWLGPAGSTSSPAPAPVPLALLARNLTAADVATAVAAAWSRTSSLRAVSERPLDGCALVVVGACGRLQREAFAHAALALLDAHNVLFLSDPAAARAAAGKPRAVVVDVGEHETRVHPPGDDAPVVHVRGGVAVVRQDADPAHWDFVARAIYYAEPGDIVPGDVLGAQGQTLLSGHQRVGAPEHLFGPDDECNVGVGVLRALSTARVLDRAEGGRDIVLCGGGCDIVGFGPRLLREMTEKCVRSERFQPLTRIVQAASVVDVPFAATMAAWIGGVVVARAGSAAAGFALTRVKYHAGGAGAVLDDDCCAVGDDVALQLTVR